MVKMAIFRQLGIAVALTYTHGKYPPCPGFGQESLVVEITATNCAEAQSRFVVWLVGSVITR
jgi:hypothetical protein